MIQEIYQKAMKFAGEMHHRQKVPGSNSNYLLHVSNVAMEVLLAHYETKDFDLQYAIQLAILHDTLEDTTATYKDLEKSFGEQVAKGVEALTKNYSIPSRWDRMSDSLQRIKNLEKEVGLVKLADRITNLQEPPPHWDADRVVYYHKEAQLIARSLSDKNEYLYARISVKIEEYGSRWVIKGKTRKVKHGI